MARSAAGFFALGLVAFGLRAEEAAPPAPAADVLTTTVAAAGSSRLVDPAGGPLGRQSQFDANLSVLERRPIGAGPWYYGWGVESQQYVFTGAPALGLDRLQEVAGQLSLEYFLKGEAVAALTVRPGLYFGNHAGASSWDAPVQAVSGIPITEAFSGVVGGSDGRLFHHAIPIVGAVWTLSPSVRVEAVYPEPALIVTLRPDWEFRLGGELTGDGFLASAGTTRTRLEYYSYRVLAALTYRIAPGAKLTLGVGAEVERVFDFYEIGRRLHARPSASVEFGLELRR